MIDHWARAVEYESRISELLERVDVLERERDSAIAASNHKDGLVELAEAVKDVAYVERNRCVAGFAALAVRLGWSAWLGRHEPDPKWDQDWMTIVFINLPTGQVSWHIHDSEVEWFSFLPTIPERTWDGHTTEQKYNRLAAIAHDVEPYSKTTLERREARSDEVEVLDAAVMWRTGRDRDIVGTAPAGGLRSATGVALIDAIDRLLGVNKRDRAVEDPAPEPIRMQCLWLFPDEDPDEGHHCCKHPAGHNGPHEGEFGAGRWREQQGKWTGPPANRPPTPMDEMLDNLIVEVHSLARADGPSVYRKTASALDYIHRLALVVQDCRRRRTP